MKQPSTFMLAFFHWCLLTAGIVLDSPAGSAPYKLIAYALLAAGAWLYLRGSGAWKRLAIPALLSLAPRPLQPVRASARG